jgi:hypothetical protein
MQRWTIEQLRSIDDIDFAICILGERKMALNPYSPLGKKLNDAVHTLRKIQDERQREQRSDVKSR